MLLGSLDGQGFTHRIVLAYRVVIQPQGRYIVRPRRLYRDSILGDIYLTKKLGCRCYTLHAAV
jgi:hypothetical protein